MARQPRIALRRREAFSLIEIMTFACVFAVLVALIAPTLKWALRAGMAAKSMNNLRQLAVANQSYAADHDGSYCPAQEPKNRVRWHGGRSSGSGKFDPTKGFLSPYLGDSRSVGICPLFHDMLKGSESFEESSGGYGYNAAYVGGRPSDPYKPIRLSRIPYPARTVMFTTTALARGSGVQEYPFAEPYRWADPNGNLQGPLQPSVHFRANGKALVVWCDGHVTAERPATLGGTDYYGGDSKKAMLGWFGPSRDNGYWNPDFVP